MFDHLAFFPHNELRKKESMNTIHDNQKVIDEEKKQQKLRELETEKLPPEVEAEAEAFEDENQDGKDQIAQ